MRVEISRSWDSFTVTPSGANVIVFFGDLGGSMLLSKPEAADLRDKLASLLPASDTPMLGDLLRAIDAERAAWATLRTASTVFDTQVASGRYVDAAATTDRIRAALSAPALQAAA